MFFMLAIIAMGQEFLRLRSRVNLPPTARNGVGQQLAIGSHLERPRL